MNTIDTIESTVTAAVGADTARSYRSYVEPAVEALTARERYIRENVINTAVEQGLSHNEAVRLVNQCFGIPETVSSNGHNSELRSTVEQWIAQGQDILARL